MLVRNFKYKDFDGNEREEEACFHLSKAEIVEMNMTPAGGLDKLIGNIIAAQDTGKIVEMIKMIIDKSYGVKSLDGRKFVKNAQVLEDFKSTEPYSMLFMELATDAEAAAKFINGIIPQDLAAEVAKQGTVALPSNS